MGYNMHMKTKKYEHSFEGKIQDALSRYGRVSFILLLIAMLIFISFDYFFQSVIAASVSQRNVEKRIVNMETELLSFMSSLDEVESNSDFYQRFYKFTIAQGIRGNVIVYDSDMKIKYITQPALEGSIYNHTYHELFINRVERAGLPLLSSSMRQDAMTPSMNTLMYGKQINDINGNVMSIIFYIDSYVLRDFLQHQSVSQMLITDSNDYVVSTTSQSFVGSLNRFVDVDSLDLSEAKYHVRQKSLGDGHLNIYALVIQKPLFEQYGWMLVFMFLTALILRQSHKKVSARIGREASGSINKLVLAVNDIKAGNLRTNVRIDSNDEFELLGDEFNMMSDQLNFLMNRNEQLVELRKNAQIKQLEAQFNPHFLYNSLETIRYLSAYDIKRAQKLILNITKLLRYSIDGEQSLVRFGDDLEYVGLYLEINKIRLDERFDYRVEVEDGLLDVLMPKLMIQPLIENSLKHGYRDRDTLSVAIVGYEDIENIYIEVSDNGTGMTQDILDKVLQMAKNPNIDSENYGLHSIVQRLNLIYGEKSHVDIQSSEKGTRICLIIPKESIDRD